MTPPVQQQYRAAQKSFMGWAAKHSLAVDLGDTVATSRLFVEFVDSILTDQDGTVGTATTLMAALVHNNKGID